MKKDTRLGSDPLDWIASGGLQAVGAEASGEPGDTAKDPAPTACPAPEEIRDPFASAPWVRKHDPDKGARLKLEQTMDAVRAMACLDDLVRAMASGRLASGSMDIPVGSRIDLEIKIGTKKDEARCSIDLRWKLKPDG